eukprot:scaffold16980_cov23-Prasinocladus_malaysianus.AAC.1
MVSSHLTLSNKASAFMGDVKQIDFTLPHFTAKHALQCKHGEKRFSHSSRAECGVSSHKRKTCGIQTAASEALLAHSIVFK